MAHQALQSTALSLLAILTTTLAFTVTTRPLQAVSSPQKVALEQAEIDIELRYKSGTEAYENAFDEFEKKAGLDQPFHYDLSSLVVYLLIQMQEGSSPLIRQIAAVYLSTMRDYEVPVAESMYIEIVRIVPPESTVWNRAPDSIRFVSENLSPEAARRFLNDLISRNPDRLIQARALISLVKLASRQHDPATYRTCYRQRAGLRRAYERFKGLNFTIVSISLGETPEAVKRFRQARWAMPWENLFLPGGQKSQTAKDYDVSWIGLPHLLLVGADGTILATRDQLGRESLQETLAEYLQP